MITIKNFYSNLLKINKESYKDIDIYYNGYITIKEFCDCANIHRVNLLYLIIHAATGHFKEKKTTKNTYFLIRQTNMKKFSLELDKILKHLIVERNCFIKKTC